MNARTSSVRKLALLSAALFLTTLVPCDYCVLAQVAASPTAPPIQVYSREIALDIDVRDADGKPVHGLTRDDFTVLENGRPQSIRGFRERSSADIGPAPGAESPAQPALGPNTFSNEAPPEGPLPLTILLIDSMDTPMANQIILEKQLNDFVGRVPQGARVAIFFLSDFGQLSMIQPFTSDPEQLHRAVKSIKTQIPPLEDAGQDPTNTDAPSNPAQAAQSIQNASAAPPPPSLLEPPVNGNLECTKTQSRVAYTYAALGEIARYVHGMAGRKNLIWFTGLYPIGMGDGKGNLCYDSQEEVASSDDLLEDAHVAVYMIDPRALDILARYGPQSRLGKLQANEHLNMERIAEQTGGRAFYNTNDLAGAAVEALSSGLDYYALTYSPSDQHWDTRKRVISVRVDKPGLKLVYKNSYNAVPPGLKTTFNGRPIEKATPVQTAMMRGAPQATEILFRVNAASAGTSPTPAPGNSPDPKAMKPPYRAIALTYTVDISNMQFDQAADGAYHGAFEYAVNVYSHDGKLLNSSTMAAKPALPPHVYESMRNSGLKLRQQVDVPVSGDAVLRIGLHDLANDHLGAIEVPVSSITP